MVDKKKSVVLLPPTVKWCTLFYPCLKPSNRNMHGKLSQELKVKNIVHFHYHTQPLKQYIATVRIVDRRQGSSSGAFKADRHPKRSNNNGSMSDKIIMFWMTTGLLFTLLLEFDWSLHLVLKFEEIIVILIIYYWLLKWSVKLIKWYNTILAVFSPKKVQTVLVILETELAYF